MAFFTDNTITYYKDLIFKETGYQSLPTNEEKIQTLLNYTTIIYIKYNFDDIYNVIWGSQLQILLHLNTLRGEGESFEDLKRFYDIAVETYGKNYTTAYEDYFQFLIVSGLIVKQGGNYHLTHKALDFIRYIPETGKNYDKTL